MVVGLSEMMLCAWNTRTKLSFVSATPKAKMSHSLYLSRPPTDDIDGSK